VANKFSLNGATNLGALSSAWTTRGVLDKSDRDDLFRFKLSSRSSLEIELSNLNANANLSLINRSGKAIAVSKQSGRRDESIAMTLDQGVYYLYVDAVGKSNTRYTLTTGAESTIVEMPTTNDGAASSPILNAGSAVNDPNGTDRVQPVAPITPEPPKDSPFQQIIEQMKKKQADGSSFNERYSIISQIEPIQSHPILDIDALKGIFDSVTQ
jgi:Bacterial pre-peptidase C-terminal domain